MGIALGSILGGILGMGGSAGEVWNDRARQEKIDALAREKMDQERAYRDAQTVLERERVTNQAAQFEQTQKGLSTPIGALYRTIGLPVPQGIDPTEAIPNAVADNVLKTIQDREKAQREATGRMGQADVLERQSAGRPAVPAMEPPDEGAMYSAGTPAQPEVAGDPGLRALAQMLRVGPVNETLAKAVSEPRTTTGAPGSAIIGPGGKILGMVPSEAEKVKPEPPDYAYIHRALGEAGWRPDMPGYNTEFIALLQAPVATAPGGRATSRTEGIRPPGSSAVGTPPSPGSGPGAGAAGAGPSVPRFRGEPAVVPAENVKNVISAIQMRSAVNQIGQALKDPTTAQYIGPYDQYRDTIQGKAPLEMAGKIPPSVVQIDANLRALHNYTIRLITGAQMNKDEVPRIMGMLPERGNQADEFRQRVKMTMDNVSMMENQIRALALQGDTNAKSIVAELGLDKFQEIQVPAGQSPPSNTRPLGQGTRVRDPRTGRTGTVPPGQPIPPGVEVIP